MIPKIIEQNDIEPLTIAECRSHLNVYAYETDSDGNKTHPDDDMILAMLATARERCEEISGYAITRKIYEIALDEFPLSNPQFRSVYPAPAPSGRNGEIELPLPPLVSVVSVMAGTDSDALMVEGTDYLVDDYRKPARLLPVGTWPSVVASTNNIKIRYIAGFGVDSDGNIPLPFIFRAAMMIALTDLYENRGSKELPDIVKNMLRPLSVRLGMA